MKERLFGIAAWIVVVVIVIGLIAGISLLFSTVYQSYQSAKDRPCWSSTDNTYQCRKYQIEQCLADERWDEATCIKIVGGGK